MQWSLGKLGARKRTDSDRDNKGANETQTAANKSQTTQMLARTQQKELTGALNAHEDSDEDDDEELRENCQDAMQMKGPQKEHQPSD